MSWKDARFNRSDYVPLAQDAGLDAVLATVSLGGVSSQVLQRINDAIAFDVLYDYEMLAHYVADRDLAGVNVGEVTGGESVTPVARYESPTGIGSDGVGVWFSTPNTGTEIVRWYLNGAQKIERAQDLTSNRSATVAELGGVAGDIVQVCIVAGGVVGWWGRIVIP